MAAPPPPPPPPPLVVDDDDGFDWEAAVREIDTACSLASTSAAAAAASAPVLPPKPSAKARQATLDRFVDSFTRRKQAKERAAAVVTSAGGGGRLGARAGEGCSGEAKEMVQEACAVVLDAEAAQTWIYPTIGGDNPLNSTWGLLSYHGYVQSFSLKKEMMTWCAIFLVAQKLQFSSKPQAISYHKIST